MMDHAVTGGKTATDASHQEGIADDPEVSRLYTPLSVAKEEIWKRWHNEDLKKEVAKFLGNDIPEPFRDRPRAVLARSVASPNRELVHFMKLTIESGLDPIILEYLSDKFVASNSDKYYSGRLFFDNGIGKNGGNKITTTKIINEIDGGDGNRICDIKTKWGENFVKFHHRMLSDADISKIAFMDMSTWIYRHGKTAHNYYDQYLALFICFGVLFEAFFSSDSNEKQFFENVFAPTADRLHSLFGMNPLMVPLFHSNNDCMMDKDGQLWMCYPEFVKHILPDNFVS